LSCVPESLRSQRLLAPSVGCSGQPLSSWLDWISQLGNLSDYGSLRLRWRARSPLSPARAGSIRKAHRGVADFRRCAGSALISPVPAAGVVWIGSAAFRFVRAVAGAWPDLGVIAAGVRALVIDAAQARLAVQVQAVVIALADQGI